MGISVTKSGRVTVNKSVIACKLQSLPLLFRKNVHRTPSCGVRFVLTVALSRPGPLNPGNSFSRFGINVLS